MTLDAQIADYKRDGYTVFRSYLASEQVFYRWKKKYGGIELADTQHLKELEEKNAELKKMLAKVMLEKNS